MRLLRADDSLSPLLKHDRPYRCSLALIDANELERQQRAPGFMTVRFVGRHHTNHVWPLKPLEIEPMAHPPSSTSGLCDFTRSIVGASRAKRGERRAGGAITATDACTSC